MIGIAVTCSMMFVEYNVQFVSTIFIEICNSGNCLEILIPSKEQLPVKVTLLVFH